MFNYKKTVNNKNTNDTRTYGNGITSCNCTNSKYLNQQHGHIITEDFRIIKNKKLCKIIRKGPNYNGSKTINGKKRKYRGRLIQSQSD